MKAKLTKLEKEKFYHIFNRGNNNEYIFTEKENFIFFLRLYNKYIYPIAETYSYCLLNNHFHFLIKIRPSFKHQNVKTVLKSDFIKSPNYISQQFSNLFNSYAKSYNSLYKRKGSLFQERFNRIEIDTQEYLIKLIYYIHYNPQKHGYMSDFRKYPFSSYNALISDKPTKLERDIVFDWFHDKNSFIEMHNEYFNEKIIEKFIGDDNF